MIDALAYAYEVATPDVTAFLRWLESNRFSLDQAQGGREKSFGNVLLDFERGGVHVRVTRDRGQWMHSLRPRDGELVGLHIWLTAIDRAEPAAPERRAFGDPLPDQLPEGVSWVESTARVIDWLETGDRSKELEQARERWARVMDEWFGSDRPT